MSVLPAVHPRDWTSINSLVEAVPRAFWKLLQNRSNMLLLLIAMFVIDLEWTSS